MLCSWVQGTSMQKKTDSPEIRNQRAPSYAIWTHRNMLDSLACASFTPLNLNPGTWDYLSGNANDELRCIRLFDVWVQDRHVLGVRLRDSCRTVRYWWWGKTDGKKCTTARVAGDCCSVKLKGNLTYLLFALEQAPRLLLQTECNDMVTSVHIYAWVSESEP